jgi:predicted regulator of Ras-like GTPase activity (Roadblock/LC7/MglB family)
MGKFNMATTILQESNSFWYDARLTSLNKRAFALLQEMDQVPGAQHAFICDRRGTTLATWVTGELARETLDRVGACVAAIFTTFGKHSFSEIEFQFEDRLMYVRTLGNAFIAVVSARGANLALLRMTLNVAGAPFEADKDLQRYLGHNSQ